MQEVWLRPDERARFDKLRERFAEEAKAFGYNVVVFSVVDDKKAVVVVEKITPVGLGILLERTRREFSGIRS